MTKATRRAITDNTLKQLRRIERTAVRLTRMRAQLKKLYDSMDMIERELVQDLLAMGGQIDLGSIKVRLADPFMDKDGTFKNTIHRAKQFKRFEIEVEVP